MSEVITAVFGNGSAASAALRDIEVARIPSAEIMPATRRNERSARDPNPQCRLVSVAVDGLYADLVSGILNMYAPVAMQKRAA